MLQESRWPQREMGTAGHGAQCRQCFSPGPSASFSLSLWGSTAHLAVSPILGQFIVK